MFGACNSTYLVVGSYCNLSCGRCPAAAQLAAVEAATQPAGEAPTVGAAQPASEPSVTAAAGRGSGGRRLAGGM